jgi:syntaxin 12/13
MNTNIGNDIKYIKYREEEIIKIENDMQQINNIYHDLTFLISYQGDTLDRIENHMETVDKNVNKGTKELSTANKHQKSANNKQNILFGIVLTVASGLGLGLGLKLK